MIEELKYMNKRIKIDIEQLNKSADTLAEKANRTQNLTFITQSNSHRKTCKDKMKKLDVVAKSLDEKLLALKNWFKIFFDEL